jgi:hypothetical protein
VSTHQSVFLDEKTLWKREKEFFCGVFTGRAPVKTPLAGKTTDFPAGHRDDVVRRDVKLGGISIKPKNR